MAMLGKCRRADKRPHPHQGNATARTDQAKPDQPPDPMRPADETMDRILPSTWTIDPLN